jgi:hypothetical protein
MDHAVHFHVRGWSVPKENERQGDDAWDHSQATGRIAIADGVSTASYSAEWASVLVRGFVDGILDIPDQAELFEAQIAELQKEWWGQVPWATLKKKGYPFDWKARQGGASTFLGISVRDRNWSAFAFGDCNLFVVSFTGEFKLSWPMENAAQFGNAPVAIRSVRLVGGNDPHSPPNVYDDTLRTDGLLSAADCLVICTDALAAYLLDHKDDQESWFDLLLMDGESIDDFHSWIRRLRKDGLRNDDCTAVVIEAF